VSLYTEGSNRLELVVGGARLSRTASRGPWPVIYVLLIAVSRIAQAADGSPPVPAAVEAVVVTAQKLDVEMLVDARSTM